jgi:hypothetical protein
MSEDLEPWVIKQLLDNIELTGKDRSSIRLIDLCQTFEQFFGLPASNRRRLIQIRFENLKRKTTQKWAEYLDRFNVPHSPATLCELRAI